MHGQAEFKPNATFQFSRSHPRNAHEDGRNQSPIRYLQKRRLRFSLLFFAGLPCRSGIKKNDDNNNNDDKRRCSIGIFANRTRTWKRHEEPTASASME